MVLINYLFFRFLIFVGVAAGVWAVGMVFLSGAFSTSAFWAAYLTIEAVIHVSALLSLVPSNPTYGVGGMALNPDGTPPAHLKAQWDREMAQDNA